MADDLDVKGAVQRIEKALAYDAPLRTRGEGLSWMVWGLIGCVLSLSPFAGSSDWPLWVGFVIVVPAWAALALSGTSAVWRLAGIARPALSLSPTKVIVGVLGVSVGVFLVCLAGFALLEATGNYVILAVALPAVPWGLLGWVQWSRLSAAGRRATVVVGFVMSLLFVTLMEFWTAEDFWDHPGGRAAYTAIIGGIPFLVGLVWTFRR